MASPTATGMPTAMPTRATRSSSPPTTVAALLPKPTMRNPMAPASPLPPATGPTNRVRKARMLGTTLTARIAGSSRAATPAGLAIVNTSALIGSGRSITQTVTPATATPSSQGTTRQRGDGTRPSGNSSNSRARAGRFKRNVQAASQAIQAAAGSDPGAVTKARTTYSNANAWTAATRPMPTNNQPMAWPGRRTASTSPTTVKPGTRTRCGDRAPKPRSRFSTSSTTAKTSSTVDSAVKALASRAGPRPPTGPATISPSIRWVEADRSPWLVFMPPFHVGHKTDGTIDGKADGDCRWARQPFSDGAPPSGYHAPGTASGSWEAVYRSLTSSPILTTNSQTSAGNQLMNGRKANTTKMRVKMALIQPSQRGCG